MAQSASQPVSQPSAWSPLRLPTFRNLLIADFVSDIGTFMQTVGAAWLMTSLTPQPIYVALIQTASALPFFLFALLAGAIGDIVDRRKLILSTESWMLAMAVILAAAVLAHAATPWLLLLITFALSAGDAFEAPTWGAIVPELVPRDELQPALALNGIEFNLARAVGPGLAGVIIAAVGVGAAFVVNALSFFGVIGVVFRWKRKARASRLPPETVGGATEAALRYVHYSPEIRTVLFRCACVMIFASANWALLPAVVRAISGTAIAYGLLVGFFGAGAVLGALTLPHVRRAISLESLVSIATLMFGGAIAGIALFRELWLLYLFGLLSGVAWTIFMSTFNTLIQTLSPDWVRARVSAVYLLVYQGSFALGGALWGAAAERTNANLALEISGFAVAACVLLRFIAPLPRSTPALDTWDHWSKPTMVAPLDPDQGPVLVTIEYSVNPGAAAGFLEAIDKYQRVRRRDGAYRWGIFYDSEIAGHFVETFMVHSWAEHERQHARFTVADRKLEDEVGQFVHGEVKVRHFIHADRNDLSE